MIVWSAPWWLLALALAPLIWWLHTFRRGGREVKVSSLRLFPPDGGRDEAGRRRAAADRIWPLRAAASAGLALALAGPGWRGEGLAPVQIWVDDSLSMAAAEAGGKTRLALGLGRLKTALDEAGWPEAEARSLADPARPGLRLSRGTSEAAWLDWARVGDSPPRPPEPWQMAPEAGHWLLTDGADGKLNAWAEQAPLSQIVQAGQAGENSALTLLALRPAGDGGWRGLAQIDNLGAKPATRSLGLAGQSWTVEVPPGESRQVEFALGPEAGEVAAQLSPADALALDDALALAAPAKPMLRIAGDCPPPVLAALRAHPRLAVGEPAALTVACGDAPAPGEGPLLRLRQSPAAQPLKDPAVWLEEAGKLQRLRLPAEWLAAHPADGPAEGRPLLLAGDRALVTVAGRRVDCYLDLSGGPLARQPEFPALLAGLVDAALGDDLLDGTASRSRPAEGSRIAPRGLPRPAPPGRRAEPPPRDLAPALLLLVAAALLADWGLRRPAPA